MRLRNRHKACGLDPRPQGAGSEVRLDTQTGPKPFSVLMAMARIWDFVLMQGEATGGF